MMYMLPKRALISAVVAIAFAAAPVTPSRAESLRGSPRRQVKAGSPIKQMQDHLR